MPYPHKPADTDVPLLDAIKQRWSPVAIGPEPIEQEKIDTLFEAARWAPSSFNEQPWRYIYATKDDGADREALESLLMDGNDWAKNAYLLIISFTSTRFKRNDRENDKALHDLGSASGYLALQCEPLGLVGHQMGGFYADKANELLGVPEQYVPGSMIAVGYPIDPSSLSEDNAARDASPRERLSQSEFVFHKHWQ